VAIINIKIPILLGNLVNILAHVQGEFSDYLEAVRVPSLHLFVSYLLQVQCKAWHNSSL
jgi:hypothetical protein